MNAFHDIPSGQLKIGTHMTFEILSTALLAPLTKHVAKLAFEGDLGIAIVEGTLDLGFTKLNEAQSAKTKQSIQNIALSTVYSPYSANQISTKKIRIASLQQ